MTEVYLLFYQAVLQVFMDFNMFLQREDPLIAVIFKQMKAFLKKLLSKFVKILAIKSAVDITSVDYSRDNQLPGICLITLLQLFMSIHTCRQYSVCWNHH